MKIAKLTFWHYEGGWGIRDHKIIVIHPEEHWISTLNFMAIHPKVVGTIQSKPNVKLIGETGGNQLNDYGSSSVDYECMWKVSGQSIQEFLRYSIWVTAYMQQSAVYTQVIRLSSQSLTLPLPIHRLSNNPSIFVLEWSSNSFHLCASLLGLQGQGLPLFIHSPSPLQLLSNKTLNLVPLSLKV